MVFDLQSISLIHDINIASNHSEALAYFYFADEFGNYPPLK